MAKAAKKQIRPKAKREEAEEEEPRRAGFFRRFLGVLVLAALGAGGAFVWAFQKDTGEWPWDNPEKAKAFLFERKTTTEEFVKEHGKDADYLLAEGKKATSALIERMTQEKNDIERWLKSQKATLPTRDELSDMASKYLAPSPREDRREAAPREEPKVVATSTIPEPPITEEEEKSAPAPKPKPTPKPEPKPEPATVSTPAPKPEPKPEVKPEPVVIEVEEVPEPEVDTTVAMAEIEEPEPEPKPVPSPKPYERPPVVAPAPKPVPSPKPDQRPPSTPQPAARSGGSSEQKGRDLMKEGVTHWKVATEAIQKGNRATEQAELAKSKKLFDQALKELTAASEQNPSDPNIQNLLVDCNRFRYDCLKRTILH